MHNEALHNLYISRNIMRIKSRTAEWAWHVASMREMQ
jgi:hypothetical protein